MRGLDLFASSFQFCLQIMCRAEYLSKNNLTLAHGVAGRTVVSFGKKFFGHTIAFKKWKGPVTYQSHKPALDTLR